MRRLEWNQAGLNKGGERLSLRNRGMRRGPSQIFKKRIIRFAANAINGSANELADITLTETGTIYAVKITVHGVGQSADGDDVQLISVFCRVVGEPGLTSIPNVSTPEQIETMNGFYVGSRTFAGKPVDVTPGTLPFIEEKFRFRRKVDAKQHVQLFTSSLVVDNAAQTVAMSGILEVIIRMR